MAGGFFSGSNFVFRFLERIFDLVILSAVWVLLCIPVVTIGPATTALYYAVVKCVRRNEQGTLGNFFTCFKANFKQSAIVGVILTALGLLIAFSRGMIYVIAQAQDTRGVVLYHAQTIFILLVLGLACWLFPMISRFSQPLREHFKAMLHIGFRHLPTTIVVAVLVEEAAQITIQYLWPVFLVPGIAALLISLFYERVFLKYTPEETTSEEEEEGVDSTPWYLK